MQHQDYSFTFSLFSKKERMFHWDNMGIIVVKWRNTICIYGTDATNDNILCAIPLCDSKYLKGETFHISFFENETATVKVADVATFIDFASKKCSNNKGVQNYGSEAWGEDIILSPNRNLTVLPAEIVPYCVGFLDHIYPLCSAKAALSGAISARNSKSAFYQGIVLVAIGLRLMKIFVRRKAIYTKTND